MPSSSSASILLAVRRLASGRGSAFSFLQRAGELLYSGLELEKILITAMHPESGEIVRYAAERGGDPVRPSEGYVLVAEDIHLRRRRIGRIEVHSARGRQSGSTILQVAEVAAEQVARFLELDSQRIRAARLREDSFALGKQLEGMQRLADAKRVVGGMGELADTMLGRRRRLGVEG